MSICNPNGGGTQQKSVTAVALASTLLWGGVALGAGDKTDIVDAATLADFRAKIVDMKDQARGPFKRLRWFCNDGTILPPKSYA